MCSVMNMALICMKFSAALWCPILYVKSKYSCQHVAVAHPRSSVFIVHGFTASLF